MAVPALWSTLNCTSPVRPVEGLGLGGLGSWVWGLGFSGFRAEGFGFVGFRVWSSDPNTKPSTLEP